MKYKILALDLDGTLLTDDKRISPRAVSALRATIDVGAIVVFCTGRRYRTVIPMVEQMGILRNCDREALTIYCRVWSQWVEVQRFLLEHGSMYPVYQGAAREDGSRDVKEFREYPQVRRALNYGDQLLRIARQFGLTAAARADLAEDIGNPRENRGRKGAFWRA